MPKTKFDVLSFMNDATKDKAILDYLERHPNIVEAAVKDYAERFIRDAMSNLDKKKIKDKTVDAARARVIVTGQEMFAPVVDELLRDEQRMTTILRSVAQDEVRWLIRSDNMAARAVTEAVNHLVAVRVTELAALPEFADVIDLLAKKSIDKLRGEK